MIEAPMMKYSKFSLWETQVVKKIYKDFWGLSLMTYLRSLQDWEAKNIFEVQIYLDSMEEVDTERRKRFQNKKTRYMSFQDIARKEMAKENKRAVSIGMKKIRRTKKKNSEQSRVITEAKQYSERIKNMNVQKNIKRYVIIHYLHFI